MNQFRYCLQCKKPITKLNDGRLLDCSCGFHLYLNPAPCTVAVLTNPKKEILFVVRGRSPRKGYLDLPGGFIEYGETAEQGIRRELQEEIGVAPKRLRYVASYPDRYFYRGIRYHVLTSAFSGVLSAREAAGIRPADDISGAEWHSTDAIPFDRFAFPSMRDIVRGCLSTRG